ncbi:MAG: carbohydrate ABC transporter permease [Chloroflexota bacterium]
MRAVRAVRSWWLDVAALAVAVVVFVIPFLFILVTAAKDRATASRLAFTLPAEWGQLLQNLAEVITARNSLMVTAMRNSVILTVASVTLIVFLSAMVGYVLQRRRDRLGALVSALMLAGLVIPPAIVPTIYVLQSMGLFKTLPGLILVEVAFLMPFSVLIFRTFVSAIPRELDEAAIIDGASPTMLFLRVILPLLRPAIITVIVVSSVAVYNDFVNPLYFLPGTDNATVQLTLFNFQSQFNTRWNLLFADVLLITIPPLVMFIFFQRQIVSGMTAGAVKG